MVTVAQFKQRMAQILKSYAVAKAGEKHSRLGKLVSGMPDRLTKCKKNKCGPINKGAPQRPRTSLPVCTEPLRPGAEWASLTQKPALLYRFASARGRMDFLDTQACAPKPARLYRTASARGRLSPPFKILAGETSAGRQAPFLWSPHL